MANVMLEKFRRVFFGMGCDVPEFKVFFFFFYFFSFLSFFFFFLQATLNFELE